MRVLNRPLPIHPAIISVGPGTPKDLREEVYIWNASLPLPIRGCGNEAPSRAREVLHEWIQAHIDPEIDGPHVRLWDLVGRYSSRWTAWRGPK